VSRLVNGVVSDHGQLRQLCRRGLLVKALELGIVESVAWERYNEHAVFGLPEVDPAVVLPEVREALAARREAKAVGA
jgi:hypothetical protein